MPEASPLWLSARRGGEPQRDRLLLVPEEYEVVRPDLARRGRVARMEVARRRAADEPDRDLLRTVPTRGPQRIARGQLEAEPLVALLRVRDAVRVRAGIDAELDRDETRFVLGRMRVELQAPEQQGEDRH